MGFRGHYLIQLQLNSILGFHVLWALSFDIMIFILYKRSILSSNPKSTHDRKRSAFLHIKDIT